MRKMFTILTAVLLTAGLFAQSPNKMSYQAVIRNASNVLVTNTLIGMKISILQGSPTGTQVYEEIQTPTTNANGLISIEIGGEAGFTSIDWSADTYYLKTEIDLTGGTTYTITGTSQLLSVPYALYAEKFGGNMNNLPLTNVTDPTNAQDATTKAYVDKMFMQTASISKLMSIGYTAQQLLNSGRTVTEFLNESITVDSLYGRIYKGGYIFYINTLDGTGLVAAATQSQGEWGCSGTNLTGASGTAIGTGAQNTADIDLECTTSGIAADYCVNLISGGFDDWFLPSIDELSAIYTNIKAKGYGSFANAFYWSSSENNDLYSQAVNFTAGSVVTMSSKGNSSYIIAARAF